MTDRPAFEITEEMVEAGALEVATIFAGGLGEGSRLSGAEAQEISRSILRAALLACRQPQRSGS